MTATTRMVLLVALGWAPALAAQGAGPGSRSPIEVSARGFGVGESEGALWGIGPDYRVRFDRDGFEFTPALGRGAPRTFPLRFRLQTVGRGDHEVPVPSPRIEVDGNVVSYARPGVHERYEVRVTGIEQSFWFETLPPGSGDLVVRGRLETELRPSAEGRETDELTFLAPGLGGVRIGNVVGIDAEGKRAPGALRLEDGVLELRLPAAFVDTARLPLVLDPPIGATLVVGSGPDDGDPDVAFDPVNDLYMVVWARRFSSGDLDVYGQRVSAGGALVGSPSPIAVGTGLSWRPRIANIGPVAQMFVVAFEEGFRIFASTVSAASGAVLNRKQISVGADMCSEPDIGASDPRFASVLVWRNDGRQRLEASMIQGNNVFGPIVVSSDGPNLSNTRPEISKSTPGDRFLIVWNRSNFATSPVQRDVFGAVLDIGTGPTLVVPTVVIATSSGGIVSSTRTMWPEVDGDGTQWIVSYGKEHLIGGNLVDSDVAARRVTFDPALQQAYVSAEIALAQRPRFERHPAVGWLDGSHLVAYQDESTTVSNQFGVALRSIDSFSGAPCEGEFTLESGTFRTVGGIKLARRTGGALAGDEALVVWESLASGSSTSQVWARLFRANDGSTRTSGSGCGRGGRTFATCAIRGNAGFAFRVRHAAASAPAVLFLSAAALPGGGVPVCPRCVLLPDPAFGVSVLAGLTDVHGDAEVRLAIPTSPGVVGAQLVAQWAILSPAPACFLIDLSDAITAAIE